MRLGLIVPSVPGVSSAGVFYITKGQPNFSTLSYVQCRERRKSANHQDCSNANGPESKTPDLASRAGFFCIKSPTRMTTYRLPALHCHLQPPACHRFRLRSELARIVPGVSPACGCWRPVALSTAQVWPREAQANIGGNRTISRRNELRFEGGLCPQLARADIMAERVDSGIDLQSGHRRNVHCSSGFWG